MTKVRTNQLAQTGAALGQALVWNGTDWLPANIVDAGALRASLFDAAGDLLIGTADNVGARLAKGTALQVLRVNAAGTTLEYATPPALLTVQDENVTVASGVSQLDFQGAGVTASIGTGEVIVTVPGPAGLVSAKGDLLVGTGAGSIARLPIGTDNFVLIADSSQPDGVRWDAASTTTGGSRTTVSYTTSSLIAGARETGIISMGAAYRLYKLAVSAKCRVRVYVSTATRDADATRPIGTDPGQNSGLMLEYVATSAGTYILSPMVDGFANSGANAALTIDNTDTVSAAITATLTYLETE